MLRLEVIGFLGGDAEHKQPNGLSVINFTVCSNMMVNGKEYKTWVQCAWWDPPLEILPRLTTGTQVWVYGTPQASGYMNNYNKVVGSLKCVVKEVHITHSAKVPEDKFAEMRAQMEEAAAPPAPPVAAPVAEAPKKRRAAPTATRKTTKK